MKPMQPTKDYTTVELPKITEDNTSNDLTVMAPIPPMPISPNASAAQSHHGKPARQGWRRYLFFINALAILILMIMGGIIGYGLGSNRSISGISNTTGWRLVSVTAQGSTVYIPQTAEIILAWDISQKAHNPQTDWYVVTHGLKTSVKDWTIDATRADQGNVTIIDHTSTGDRLIYGTAHGNTLQITIPPNSHLYPEITPAFLTLTFAPANTSDFNQILQGGGL